MMKTVFFPRPSECIVRDMNRMQDQCHGFWQSGMTIVELLVGIAIGMLTVLAVMQISGQAEQWRRNASIGADAQTSGQIATFTLGREILEAGGGLSAITICDPGVAWARYNNADVSFPIPSLPVVIRANGTYAAGGDTIEVIRSRGVAGAWPVDLAIPTTGAASPLTVWSTEGFTEGGLALIRPTATGVGFGCTLVQVSSITSGGSAGNGSFDLAHSAGPDCLNPLDPTAAKTTCLYNIAAGLPKNYPTGTDVYSLGVVETHRFEVQKPGAAAARLMFGSVPFASGIVPAMTELVGGVVFLKAFYGFDTSATPDGQVDLWLSAGNCTSTATDWVCTDGTHSVTGNSKGAVAARLITVRIGVVTRSGQHDKNYTSPASIQLWDWACPAGITCPANPTFNVPAGEQDYRYRVHQTVIGLRTPTWNQVYE